MWIVVTLLVLCLLAGALGPAAMEHLWVERYCREIVILVLFALVVWSYPDWRAWSAAHPPQHRLPTYNSSGAWWLGE